MWSMKTSRRPASRRAAANSVCGDFSARRCPTITARRKRRDLASGCRAVVDWKITRALPRSDSGSARGPRSCRTTSACASASERCAEASVAMSR